MTKNQLIRLLYYKNNTLTRKIISQAADLILNEISKGVLEQKDVEIRGFGRFSSRKRREKILRHPTTAKLIKIPSYKTMHYSCSVRVFET